MGRSKIEVRKYVRVQRVKGDVAVLRVSKNVRLQRVKGDVAILC